MLFMLHLKFCAKLKLDNKPLCLRAFASVYIAVYCLAQMQQIPQRGHHVFDALQGGGLLLSEYLESLTVPSITVIFKPS